MLLACDKGGDFQTDTVSNNPQQYSNEATRQLYREMRQQPQQDQQFGILTPPPGRQRRPTRESTVSTEFIPLLYDFATGGPNITETDFLRDQLSPIKPVVLRLSSQALTRRVSAKIQENRMREEFQHQHQLNLQQQQKQELRD